MALVDSKVNESILKYITITVYSDVVTNKVIKKLTFES